MSTNRLDNLVKCEEHVTDVNKGYPKFSTVVAATPSLKCDYCDKKDVDRLLKIDRNTICLNCLQEMQNVLNKANVTTQHPEFILQLMEAADEGNEKLQEYWEQCKDIGDRKLLLKDDVETSAIRRIYLRYFDEDERKILAADIINTILYDKTKDEIGAYIDLFTELYEFAPENVRKEIKEITPQYYPGYSFDGYTDEQRSLIHKVLGNMSVAMMYDEEYNEFFMGIIKKHVNDNNEEISRGAQIHLRLMWAHAWMPEQEQKWIKNNCAALSQLY